MNNLAARPMRSLPRAVRGFIITELILGIAVIAALTAFVTQQQVISQAEDAYAKATGGYLDSIREALALYSHTNFERLEAGTAVAGVANPMAPTVAELKANGWLNAQLPDRGPGGFVPLITGTRVGCPSPSVNNPTCRIGFVASTPASMVFPRTGNMPRYDMAATAMQEAKGGGMSFPTDPNRLRGATFNINNPIAGNPGAVVGSATYLDTAFYNQFVRMNDWRDPNLQGNLTVGGNLLINGTTRLVGDTRIDGQLVVMRDITAAGSVGAGNNGLCNRAEMLPDGRIVARSDCSDANRILSDPTNSQLTIRRGGIDRIALDASTGSGRIGLSDWSGASTVNLDGGAGRVSARYLNVDGTAQGVSGQACATEGDIVKDASGVGTALFCRSGVWRPFGPVQAQKGAACTNEGSFGVDPATLVGFVCRAEGGGGSLVWVKLSERVTRSVLVARYFGKNGWFIPAPTADQCPSPGVPTVLIVPAETATDYALLPPRNRYVAAAVPSGGGWLFSLKLSDGTAAYDVSYGGSPYDLSAFALVHCDY